MLLSAACGLLLPGPLRLFALVPAAFLPRCAPGLLRPFHDAAWSVTRETVDRKAGQTVCVDESLLVGPPVWSARACMPLSPVSPEQFRSQSGAMLLSAAAALTAPQIPELLPEEALLALNIRPDNLRRQYPTQGACALGDHPGLVVRDGKGQRAFFISADASLAEHCQTIYDRGQRSITNEDLALIHQRPGLHFAAAEVEGGVPGPAVYLGSIEPLRSEKAHPDALTAIAALHADGLPVVFAGRGDYVRAAGLPLRAAQPGNVLRIRRTGGESHDFDQAIQRFLRHEEMLARRRRTVLISGVIGAVAAMGAGAFLAAVDAALLSPAGIGFALCALCLSLVPPVFAIMMS